MSCCSLPSHPKGVAGFVLRFSFGLSLLFVGLKHLMTIDGFSVFVAQDLGALAPLGQIWAYVYCVLLIAGGVLFVLGMYKDAAAWAAGLALGSIPVGMLLKPILGGVDLSAVMPAVHNTWIWVLVYFFVVKCSCCEGECK